MLYLFITAPTNTIQDQCNFYSGISCVDYEYTLNAGGSAGSTLSIELQDLQTGVLNISSFSAYLQGTNSTSGSCTPGLIAQGQTARCTASFAATPSIGNVYYGGMAVQGNYCTPNPGETNNIACPASNAFTYTGSVVMQATK